jgi:Holliday junction resolvasome RuvABC endonuclease subunit
MKEFCFVGDCPNFGHPLFFLCFKLKDVRNMSKVMSVDQSTRCSGYCFVEDNEYICSGVIDMSKSELETPERSFEMAKAIWKLIKKYKPDYLIIEDVQNQSSTKTVIILARLQGLILGYAEAHGVQTHILAPTAWRRELNYSQGPKVKRAELKQQSADYVKKTYGFVKSEDENEAIALNDAARKKFEIDDFWE